MVSRTAKAFLQMPGKRALVSLSNSESPILQNGSGTRQALL